MPSPIERMIDAAMRCLCCNVTLAVGCDCAASGVWCGICHKCATHCEGTKRCDNWWVDLAFKVGKDVA